MRYFEATSTIDAPAEAVWAVLLDAQAWPAWDSGVEDVKGAITSGARITIRSQAAPGRAFPVRVTALQKPHRLVFSGGMPLGLFKGVRTYTLTPGPDDTTVFRMREEYSGLLLGLIWSSMPDLGPSFVQFAEGLKKRVESGQ